MSKGSGSVSSDIGDGMVRVRMEKDNIGRSPSTKYYISISSSEEGNVCKQVVSTPAFNSKTGHEVLAVPCRGSSDKLIQYVPTPGDIRRMVGKDKIDENPEYVGGADPDWTERLEGVKKKFKSPEVLEGETMNEYDGESKRKSREESESLEMYTATSGESGEYNLNKGCSIKLKDEAQAKKKVLIVEPAKTKLITPPKADKTLNHQYAAKRIKNVVNKKQKSINTTRNANKTSKPYNVAVDMVKRMKPKHWMAVNVLYKKLEKDKCVDYKLLKSEIGKIIQEIYGNDSYQYLTINIDKNYTTCVMKLAKILLNIYHEVSNDCSKRCNTNVKKAAVKKSEKIVTPVRKTFTKCVPCPTDLQKNDSKNASRKSLSPPKFRVQARTRNAPQTHVRRLNRDLFPGTKPKIAVRTEPVPQKPNESIPYDICVHDTPKEEPMEIKESANESYQLTSECGRTEDTVTVNSLDTDTTNSSDARDSMLREMGETRRSLLDLEQSLFTLFSSSEDSNQLNEAMMYKFCANHPADEFFSTTLNLFWLNEQLENSTAADNQLYDADVSDYDDCDTTSSRSSEATDKCVDIINTSPKGKLSRWLPLDCQFNRSYINVFISVLFGLTAAYLSREQDHSDDKLPVKVSLKKYLKTLLEGALRLVNDF